MTARALLLSGATALALWAGGCGDDDDSGESGESGGELTVSAAASLTDAFPDYGETLDGEERFSFAGSDELAAQIRQGATPDVFASANTTYPDDLYDEGLVEEPVVFTRNQLVIAVPADSDLESIDDLTEPDLDVVIGAKGVPVGDYTREALGGLPQTDSAAILDNVRSEESDVKGIVGKLTQGAADAGFVYITDVQATNGELKAIRLPANLEPDVTYGAGVVTEAQQPELAQHFVDGLTDGDCATALQEAGFGKP